MTARRVDSMESRGCSWWTTCVGGGMILLLFWIVIGGTLYQEVATAIDLRRYPPPGSLIDVGGHRFHLHCLGTGSPTVILEAGLGDDWLTWDLVQEEIAGITRVCSYDRAGLGWSDSAHEPLRSAQVAEVLHSLLLNASIPGPYLLVGHSIGGIYIRSFAHQYPGDVAGMVLVDSSHENQNLRFPEAIVQSEFDKLSGLRQSLDVCRHLAPIGLVRLFGLTAASAREESLSPEQHAALVARMNRTGYCQAVKGELESAIRIEGSRMSPPDGLRDIPLIVLTVPSDPESRNPGDLPAGTTLEILAQADRIQMELQRELAALSTNGSLVVVDESGHYIQFDRPEIVIDAVRRIMEFLRA